MYLRGNYHLISDSALFHPLSYEFLRGSTLANKQRNMQDTMYNVSDGTRRKKADGFINNNESQESGHRCSH